MPCYSASDAVALAWHEHGPAHHPRGAGYLKSEGKGSAMSNLEQEIEQPCTLSEGCGAVELMIEAQAKDLGGFSVRRTLPNRQRKLVGPWIFFDHMGPAEFPAGQGIDVRPHPHIGIATVTYLFEGEILHRDSLGTCQAIQPGDINLMVTGKGMTHSERERPEVRGVPHRLHGLQLWLVLPEALEETEPAFHHYPAATIPQLEVDGVVIRVMMGAAYGVTSPVTTFAETLYVEAFLKPGQKLQLPMAQERAVYVAQGRLQARDTAMPQSTMTIFKAEEGIVLEALEASRIALIGGETMARRHIEWNFVSSRRERIQQAKADWSAGKFPLVPGDDQEFIPLPG